MALLDLQVLETPADAQIAGGGGSGVSLLLCDKHSSHSNILCL